MRARLLVAFTVRGRGTCWPLALRLDYAVGR